MVSSQNNVCVHVKGANETPDKWVEAKDKERCGEALEEDKAASLIAISTMVAVVPTTYAMESEDFPTTDNRYRDSADY